MCTVIVVHAMPCVYAECVFMCTTYFFAFERASSVLICEYTITFLREYNYYVNYMHDGYIYTILSHTLDVDIFDVGPSIVP